MKVFPQLSQVAKQAAQGYDMIPIWREMPSDILTPVGAYLRLTQSLSQKKKPAFLLESGEGGEQVGRYSFLGVDPVAKIYSDHDCVVYEDIKNQSISKKSLTWKNIEAYLTQWQAPSIPTLPPFSGGAVGYVSYEASSLLESIPLPKDSLKCPIVNFMIFRSVVVFDRLKHRVFLISHAQINSSSVKKAYQNAIEEIEFLYQKLFEEKEKIDYLPIDMPLIQSQDISPKRAKSSMGAEGFHAATRSIKKHILRGDIFQCVLSDRFSFKLSANPMTIYRVLRMINPSPYLYFLSFDEHILLGSSPEMLLRCHDRKLETCPIAGTRPRGQTQKEDEAFESALRSSVKECAEHLMLVDLGRNDIGRVSRPGSVQVKRFMHTERFSHVMHLVSLIEGKLSRSATPWEALGACFPAGTLSGAPKIRAMELISQYEKTSRGVYGGAVVAMDFCGNINSCITIRSLYAKNGYGYVQAGAGIVADSRPKNEYDEICSKSKAVRVAVTIAEQMNRSI